MKGFLKTVVCFTLAVFFFSPAVYAEEDALHAKAARMIQGNCDSLVSFAHMATKDRNRITKEEAEPHYFDVAKRNLQQGGYTPILTERDKNVIRGIMGFMWESRERTPDDYTRACLAGEEKASPPWYRAYVKEYGVPQRLVVQIE